MKKNYVIIERFSSRDIFSFLDSIESDDMGDIENIINDSDTEFVAEDESVIFNNIIRKHEIGDQKSFASVAEASIHIFSTKNEDKTHTLGQDESNPAPATQRTSKQSPVAATQHSSNQSPAPASQCTADQSPSPVVTRCTSNHSSKSPPPTVTLPKNNKKLKQNLMTKERTKKEKGQCFNRIEQHKPEKMLCPARRRQKKTKNNTTEKWKWEDK